MLYGPDVLYTHVIHALHPKLDFRGAIFGYNVHHRVLQPSEEGKVALATDEYPMPNTRPASWLGAAPPWLGAASPWMRAPFVFSNCRSRRAAKSTRDTANVACTYLVRFGNVSIYAYNPP